MEEKKIMELSDENLDGVTGGSGFVRPSSDTMGTELMAGQKECGSCGRAVFPKWDQAKRKNVCPNCGEDL